MHVPSTELLMPTCLFGCRLSAVSPAAASSGAFSLGSTAKVSQWYIDPATIEVCRHADGTPCKLGQGGFGSVSAHPKCHL